MVNRGLCTLPVSCLATLFLAGQATAAAASPRACPAAPPTAKEQLAGLCKTHEQEPACRVLPDLSEDDAWLVLREACRGERHELCDCFRLNQGGLLVYDMKGDEWKAEWESRSYPLTFDVAGVPTMQLRPSQAKPLKILISNVSPLTYSAAPGTPKEQDLAVVADLKSVLALAGTGVQGLVQTLAFVEVARKPTQTIEVQAEITPKAGSRGRKSRAPGTPPSAPDPCKVDPPGAEPLARALRVRALQLVALRQALGGLDHQLGLLDERRTRFIRAVQMGEDGPLVPTPDLSSDVPDVSPAYQQVSSIVTTLDQDAAALVACEPLLDAYARLLAAHPSKPGAIVGLAEDVMSAPGCPEFHDDVFRNALALRTLAMNSCEAELKTQFDLQQELLKPYVDRLSDVRSSESKIWQAVDKVMAAKKDVLAGAATLEREIADARRHTWNGALIRELVVTRQNPNLGWSKVQTHAIVIKADSPYVKELTLSRGTEEKREYKLESATGRILGYGIGLVYTPLFESKYTAATVPGTKTKVIAETGRETRAGDLAAFLSYRFLEHRPAKRAVQPTLDVGVGLTSGRTAFFVGLGGEFFHSARVAFGWTAQRITVLEPGQEVNQTVVTSNDDIRTRTQFDTGHYYVSFSFALDSLPLFSK